MDLTASPLSPAEQALIRRERRLAKVKSTAGARLNRITSTQGQTFRKEDETPKPPPSRSESTPDPPDVDISAHHYEPKSRQQERQATENIFASMMGGPPPPGGGSDLHQPSDMDLQQLLMSMNRGPPGMPGAGMGMPGMPGMGMPGMPGMGATGDDPMLAMLQQMMSTGGGMPGMGPGMQMPPGMTMPPGMEGLAGMMGMQDSSASKDWGGWWRVLHGLCAFLLGLWAVKATGWSFSGSAAQRAGSVNLPADEKPQLFWYFTTMELVLQSSRFFLEKGRPPPGSWLSTIGSFLPRPFSTVLTTIARYSVIWTTIMADAGVLLFCLGVFAWWNT
ncbi:hypothetical protein Q9L58_005284 [Maublancomyces gigas]|uniref:Uncharacterized protein n=1 Tax=Discina gigas TaxID=1032678 RepID=A0ABR3GII6_9PEZI